MVVPSFISNIELSWELPSRAPYVAEPAPARCLELVSGAGRRGAANATEAFLTGVNPRAPSERLLATVLFTDLVGSTELAAELGDSGWRELLLLHDRVVEVEVARHRGRVVKSLGDGALAVFDGPSRALGCALAVREGIGQLGLSVRAGLHTGECELLPGEDVGGIAIHIAARIAALAVPGEVLASSTVRDLTVGSPFRLESRGEHELKGLADRWRLFTAHGEDAAAPI